MLELVGRPPASASRTRSASASYTISIGSMGETARPIAKILLIPRERASIQTAATLRCPPRMSQPGMSQPEMQRAALASARDQREGHRRAPAMCNRRRIPSTGDGRHLPGDSRAARTDRRPHRLRPQASGRLRWAAAVSDASTPTNGNTRSTSPGSNPAATNANAARVSGVTRSPADCCSSGATRRTAPATRSGHVAPRPPTCPS